MNLGLERRIFKLVSSESLAESIIALDQSAKFLFHFRMPAGLIFVKKSLISLKYSRSQNYKSLDKSLRKLPNFYKLN